MFKVRALLTQGKMEFSMLSGGKKTREKTLNEGMDLRNLNHVLQSPGIDPKTPDFVMHQSDVNLKSMTLGIHSSLYWYTLS